MISYKFDIQKSLNALLFIANNIAINSIADKYSTLKILYFAEKKHLAKYGRLITDDKFAALKYGPVPSNSYDILDNPYLYSDYFTVLDNKRFIAQKASDVMYLSESDIECLNEAIIENGKLSFEELMIKSHDSAYHEAFDNGIQYMNIESIAKQTGVDSYMLGFIKEHYDAANLLKWLPA